MKKITINFSQEKKKLRKKKILSEKNFKKSVLYTPAITIVKQIKDK